MGIDSWRDSAGTPAPHYTVGMEDAFLPSAPTQWLAATYARREAATTSVALAGTTGISVLQGIYLKAGWPIKSISFMSGGTTALSAGTHQWFFITDRNLVQVATTHDDTSTAWGTNTVKTLAIEAVAAGSASVYNVPATDLYYLGYNIQAGTLPTGAHNNGFTANVGGLAPILAGTSADSASTSTAPAFPKTYGALTAVAKILYGGVS